MSSRLDVLIPLKKRDGSTYWHKIGAAFPKDYGRLSVELDSLPISDADGRCSLLLSPARQQGSQRQQEAPRSDHGGGYAPDHGRYDDYR